MQYEIDVNGRACQVGVRRAEGRFVVTVDGREWTVDAIQIDAQTWSLIVGGVSREVIVVSEGAGQLSVDLGVTAIPVAVNSPRRRRAAAGDRTSGRGVQRLTAPMPGRIVRVLARPGDAVKAQQPVVVIEAMKMENELRAGFDGVVSEMPVRDGQSVEAGALLAVIAPA